MATFVFFFLEVKQKELIGKTESNENKYKSLSHDNKIEYKSQMNARKMRLWHAILK